MPFWEEVFYTERRAGAIVADFIETVKDPVMKEAVALQGFEEARHAKLIRVMIEKYGIDAAERPLEDVSDNVETRFKDFGFGECMDSFLGFGVFKIAMQSEFLPKEMFDIFETLMYEETRHIVFFVNWMAYTQAQKGFAARLALPFDRLSLLYARAGPHDRHRQARQGAERRQGILRHPGVGLPRRLHLPPLPGRLLFRKSPPHGRVRQGIAAPQLPAPAGGSRAVGAMRLWSFRTRPLPA